MRDALQYFSFTCAMALCTSPITNRCDHLGWQRRADWNIDSYQKAHYCAPMKATQLCP
jgi:hypothetical protein